MKFWDNVNLLIKLGHTSRQEVCSHLGITLGHLSLLINGKRNTNSAKMERMAELVGYSISDLMRDDFLVLIKDRFSADILHENISLSQEVPFTDRDYEVFKALNIDPREAQKLHRIFLIKAFPPSRKSLKTFVLANQIGTVISAHGGENVFAFPMPDGTLEPVCSQGGILVFDADQKVEPGCIGGMVYAGRVLIRKIYLQNKHLILQSTSGDEPPQLVGKESLINCFRAVECIKKL